MLSASGSEFFVKPKLFVRVEAFLHHPLLVFEKPYLVDTPSNDRPNFGLSGGQMLENQVYVTICFFDCLNVTILIFGGLEGVFRGCPPGGM